MEKLEKIELYKNAVLFKGFASTNPNFTQEVDENRDYFMVKRNKGGNASILYYSKSKGCIRQWDTTELVDVENNANRLVLTTRNSVYTFMKWVNSPHDELVEKLFLDRNKHLRLRECREIAQKIEEQGLIAVLSAICE